MSVGSDVRWQRLLSGIPQFRLAQAVGITQSRLSEYELGKRTPSPEMVEKLRAALALLVAQKEVVSSGEETTEA
ncbi:MAG: helix-turn-helix transcriptional regulator [Chloroflexi bacterium]|nr:helix-turn-helix transcriptional regulator [Chloroflexota bacterium]